AVHEVAYANQLGLDVIITDHHEPPEILPNAYSIINPKLPTSTYPFPLLAGVGVSFKLALAISGKWKPYWMEWTAIGTIADLVPLVGENRILAKLGLGRLNESPTVGVNAIIRSAGLGQKEITAGHIGFSVAPRINASGRLDTASAAVDLLLCQDEKQAVMLANQLSNLNEERQHLVQQTIDEAKLQVEADLEGNKYCIVVGHTSWNAGVIGIVASKLVDLYYRPTIVCSFDDEQGIAKGSARSISGFHLYESLQQCEDVLAKYGGHEMAAGMSLEIEHFQSFKKRMNEVAEKSLTEEDYIPRTVIDASLSIAQMNIEIIKQLQRLAPFGMGNRTPRLMIEDVTIQDKRYMGREQEHVKLLLKKGNHHLNAIAFKKREQMENLSLLASPKLCGELSINEWNGRTELQFIIHDIDLDKIQFHDFRNKEANACLDWNEKTKPVLLFFTEEAKQGFIRLNGHINPAISPYMVRWSEELHTAIWQEITHLFLMEVPSSDTLLKDCLKACISLEHVSLYWSKEIIHHNEHSLDRNHFKKLYNFLYASQGTQTRVQLESWAIEQHISLALLHKMVSVFQELNMIDESDSFITLVKNPIKRDLEESRIYREAHHRELESLQWIKMNETQLYEKMMALTYV
ncbi:MAG: single-stranded-DNA-specific exonuclease RecJ, partial [Bacilli bacterium]